MEPVASEKVHKEQLLPTLSPPSYSKRASIKNENVFLKDEGL